MQFNMNIANTRPSSSASVDTKILERLRSANARLQMQVNAANRKAEGAKQAEADLARVTDELAKARKTISELTAKLKAVSAKFEKKTKPEKTEKIENPNEIKISVS